MSIDFGKCEHGRPITEECPQCAAATRDPSGASAADPKGGRGPSQATRLVDLARAEYTLGWAADGSGPFAVRKGEHLARGLRGGRNSLRAALAQRFHETTGQAASAGSLADALTALEGYCEQSEPTQVHLRAAVTGDRVWLDLGDESGRVVEIGPDGWRVLSECPVIFRRTELTGPLPEPRRGGNLSELWQFANVATHVRPVLIGWLVASLLPDRPCPAVALLGEQGCGKTTATRRLGELTDPNPAGPRKPPKDIESWVSAAQGSRNVALDNLSSIPDWLSDSLCRAVTGDGDVRRTLYSDSGLTVFQFRRAIVLNGIDFGGIKPDLADRLIPVQLERIAPAARIPEHEMPERWAAAWPGILGCLLDLTASVLHYLTTQPRPAELPRMADFARILHALDAITGSAAAAAYVEMGDELAGETVATDPVLTALQAEVTGLWEGTAGELFDLLEGYRPAGSARDWPKSARGMTSHLTRHAPSLRRVGWTVEQSRDKHSKRSVWRLEPPSDLRVIQDSTTRNSRKLPAGNPQTAAPSNPELSTTGPKPAAVAAVAAVESLPTLFGPGEVRRDSNTTREGPETTAATAATAANPDLFAPGAGPCTICRATTHRYGDGGNPLCQRCKSVATSTPNRSERTSA